MATFDPTNGLNDVNNNRILGFTTVSSSVNYVYVQNNTTGNGPVIGAAGSDTDVTLNLKSQAAGKVILKPGTNSVNAIQLANAAATAILSIDTTNSRVGVNTTTPGVPLHVVGNMQVFTGGGSIVGAFDTTNTRLGVGTATPSRTLDVVGASRTQQLLGSSAAAPTAGAAGTGAGTSGTPTITLTGATDVAGKITVLTSSSCATDAEVVTLTFGSSYPSNPRVVLYPANKAAASLDNGNQIFIDDATLSTTAFTLKSNGTALANTTTYIYYYHVIG